ncbi:MAG: nucleotidyltransferase family protein [archaeon]
MKAVILAGGIGERLRPLTETIPKVMMNVQGRTLIEHVFDILKRAGITEVYLSIGYMADKIQAYYGDGKKFGMKIHYLVEKERLGTGGWMRLIERPGEDIFVMNGDNLYDLDLREVYRSHRKMKADATIVLTKVGDVRHYGIVELKDDRIMRFVEKPTPEEAPSDYANSGYYVFSPSVFDFMPADKDAFMLEKDLFPAIAQKGLLCGFRSSAQWFDTGTHEQLRKVNDEWLKR